MKQFDLEEYKKNPNKPIITRCGCQARIVCTRREDGRVGLCMCAYYALQG